MKESLKIPKRKPYMARVIPKPDVSPKPGYITEAYLLGEGSLASSRKMAELLDRQSRLNSDPKSSELKRDPCEVDMITLQEGNCENLVDGDCSVGMIIKEGIMYCPKLPQKMVGLRSPLSKA